MSEPDDFSALLDALVANDPVAAKAVMTRTYSRIVLLVRKRIGLRFQAKVDADSVANSVLKTFFRRNTTAPYVLTDWEDIWRLLTEIARTKLLNRFRRYQQLKRDVGAEVGITAVDPAALADGPEAEVIVRDLCDHLMAGYVEEERGVIELSVQGYSVEEIAARVGVSTRTVIRVRTKFRKMLEAELATGG